MKLIHCSYHKCLTVYFGRVLTKLCKYTLRFRRGYKHFNSMVEEFYEDFDKYKVASVNNHSLDLTRLGNDFRITRFIRDPRDLVVSGYHYHKRGAEYWTKIVNPTDADWEVVNGCVPENMGKCLSFSSFLQGLNEEDGLIAEIDFRKKHFDSMKSWPMADPRIKLFRYEDLIKNELDIFKEIFLFYGFSRLEKRLGLIFADRLSAKKRHGKIEHIRDPKPAQWKGHFTQRVKDYFEQRHGGLLERYGYQADSSSSTK